MSTSPAEIIDAKGGPIEFAQKIGAKVEEVRVWKSRNRLPRTRWLEIHQAYPDLTLDVLRGAEQAA